MMRIGLLTGIFILSLTSNVVGQDDDEYERMQIVTQRKMAMFDMQDAYFALFAIKKDQQTTFLQSLLTPD